MQAKYCVLTAAASALVAMGAQAQTSYPGSTPSQVYTPPPATTQPSQLPTQPSTIIEAPSTQPSAIVVEKRAPGVTTAPTREDVRAETRAEMKAGHIPRGEQSTATQGMKPDSKGSEVLWR